MKIRGLHKIRLALILILLVAVIAVLMLMISSRKAYEDKRMNASSNITIVESPDQTEAMEHPAFIREEYVSIVPEGTNIAGEGKFIDANSYADVYVPRKAIDGNLNGASYWEAAADSYPNILEIGYEESHEIHAVKVGLCPKSIWGKRYQEFSVEITEDGQNYRELIPMTQYEFTPDRNNEVVLEFDPVSIMGIRLNFISNTGASGAQVAEFEVYSKEVID